MVYTQKTLQKHLTDHQQHKYLIHGPTCVNSINIHYDIHVDNYKHSNMKISIIKLRHSHQQLKLMQHVN